MNNKIKQTIEKFNMLSSGDTVLLAVSGGADSMLMLDYFIKNKDKLMVSIKVAHIEHGIRGSESVDDALFVKHYCENNGIEFNMLSIDAIQEARLAGLGVEEYSRNKRYEFFASIPCDKIATAHNLTDNIETVLYRLARGTGLKGACGIPPVRDNIIRPLIEIPSSDIRKFCNSEGIPYRVDSTNLDVKYSRNKIRNEILPLLSSINSDYEMKFADFISACNEDNGFILSVADSAYTSSLDENRLNLHTLRNYDASIVKRVIQKYFTENSYPLERRRICDISQLLYRSGKVQISGDIYAVSNKDYLRIADLKQISHNFNFVTEILNINEFNSKNIDFYCDYDKIIGRITVRERLTGDKIRPAGRNCEKSLKKLFNELSIPIEFRNRIAVICDDSGIIGVARYCVDERVRVDSNTEKVITIKFPLED